MSVSSGVGAFATAKRKAREAAGREAAPVLLCSKVQPNNTNKLARFASLDVDQRRVDHLSTTAAAAESKGSEETAASASLIKSPGRCHASAAGGGSGSGVATASVSKRTLQGLDAVPGVTGSVSASGTGCSSASASGSQATCRGGSGRVWLSYRRKLRLASARCFLARRVAETLGESHLNAVCSQYGPCRVTLNLSILP